MKNVVILISGRGSNMEAVVRAAQAERWDATLGARIAAVVANRADAAGLEVARALGVPTRALDHREFASREAFDAALMQMIDEYAPTLVVLAGFMRILSQGFVAHYAGRMINIHPSLLPAFAGLHTHRQALQAGVKLHGATVHFVTPALDHGPIIAQAAVEVRDDDGEADLSARVLAQEHRILPQAVRWFLEGALHVEHGVVKHRDQAACAAMENS
mgnify:FL=1